MFKDLDILEIEQSRAQRALQGRPDASFVIVVNRSGVGVSKFTVGHQEGLDVSQALDLLTKPGIRLQKGE